MSAIITTYPMQLLAGAALAGCCFLFWWRKQYCSGQALNFQDGIQIALLGFTSLSLVLIVAQVEKSAQANIAATRGQLYTTESSLAGAEMDDEDKMSLLSSIYVVVPPTYSKEKYSAALMGLIGGAEGAMTANSAHSLYSQLYGFEAFREDRERKNAKMRIVFLHLQDVFYHVHNAHDYWKNGILSEEEWNTWKGYIKEIGPHPLLLAVLWNGHRNKYFSREFARFLQRELCPQGIPPDEIDRDVLIRNSEFVRYYYEEMTREDWPNSLPHYR